MAKQYVAPPASSAACYYLDWVDKACYISTSLSQCTQLSLSQKEVSLLINLFTLNIMNLPPSSSPDDPQTNALGVKIPLLIDLINNAPPLLINS